MRNALGRIIFTIIRLHYLINKLLKKRAVNKLSKIAIINLYGIGDVLLTTPSIRAIKKGNPSSELFYICQSSAVSVLINNPRLDEIVSLRTSSLIEWVKYGWKMFRKHIDLSIVIHPGERNSLAAYLSFAKYKIGYLFSNVVVSTGGVQIKNFKLDKNTHWVDCGLLVIRALGCKPSRKDLEIYASPEDIDRAKRFFQENTLDRKYTVGLFPGGKWEWKRWGSDKFAESCNLLKCKYNVVLIGGISDQPIINEVVNICGDVEIPSLITKTLGELTESIRQCDVLVTNDTVALHIADAVRTRTVSIFGPTNPKKLAPQGAFHKVIFKALYCQPCYNEYTPPICKNPQEYFCFKSVLPSEVFENVERLVKIEI